MQRLLASMDKWDLPQMAERTKMLQKNSIFFAIIRFIACVMSLIKFPAGNANTKGPLFSVTWIDFTTAIAHANNVSGYCKVVALIYFLHRSAIL